MTEKNKAKTGVSREYLAACGAGMTRAEAVRHFGNRELKLKEEIRALPLAEKFRLVAGFLEFPKGAVNPKVVLNVARLALFELESESEASA